MKATIKPQNVSHSENFPALSPNKSKYVNTFWKQFDVWKLLTNNEMYFYCFLLEIEILNVSHTVFYILSSHHAIWILNWFPLGEFLNI